MHHQQQQKTTTPQQQLQQQFNQQKHLHHQLYQPPAPVRQRQQQLAIIISSSSIRSGRSGAGAAQRYHGLARITHIHEHPRITLTTSSCFQKRYNPTGLGASSMLDVFGCISVHGAVGRRRARCSPQHDARIQSGEFVLPFSNQSNV